ncbi:MAG: hypothetical protein JRJ12_07470 [Deltaproteobacteria bacterium]|nr:hypothetical protein [Deltaproteobacteria bacterium]MBW2071295.1 hypothetical protein [Deltaproteobacteria bacterium]
MLRNILHLDIRNFCIALEQQRRPELKQRPLVIAPGQGRTPVLAASAAAAQEGIKPGMVVSRARQHCRRLTILPPDFSFYRQVQREVWQALATFSPLVESAGWGHFFVDVTGTRRLWGATLEVADRMQKLLLQKMQLDSAVGLASNKLVSKVAARVIRVQELYDVFPGGEAAFLAPLGVQALPGVGDVTAKRLLADLNLSVIGDLAAAPSGLLETVFGRTGQRLRRMALGEDFSPVTVPEAAPLLRKRMQLREDENRRSRLLGHLYGLVEELGRQLRAGNRCPGALDLTVIYADGVQTRAWSTCAAAGSEFFLDSVLFQTASRLFARAGQRRVRVRGLVLTATQLHHPIGQLSLFSWDDHCCRREEQLVRALDHIRQRYGAGAIYYGKVGGAGLPLQR